MIFGLPPLMMLIYVIVSALVSALLLYVVVRFGVKHGMRAYHADERRPPRC